MDFRDLPGSPDHPRYVARLREITDLLKQKKERLVEEGMLLDRATADDDFWWFCKRFTSFQHYPIEERGHPYNGTQWIDHPYVFWLFRLYQEFLVEPSDGWVWVEIHRLGLKTTGALALCLWVHSVDDTHGGYPRNVGLSKTIGLWTHKQEEIGTGMGRGQLHQLQSNRLRDHYPQFRNLREGTKQGYVVDRPPGPREQSLLIQSILQAPESKHPDIYLMDDVVTSQLRGNVDQIAKIQKNISDIAAIMTPDAPMIVFNTPKDKADPLIARERAGLFSRVIKQAATRGGDFTPAGSPNMHTMSYYSQQRKAIHDDSLYFMEFELEFRENSSTLFSWEWIYQYEEPPELVAKASPFINIIVDGAKGNQNSDFTVIRVITWTANDRWATLDLIRERIGSSKAMQILLGRDKSDPTSEWIENGWDENGQRFRGYCPGGVGLIEKWMRIDSDLAVWFDNHGNQGWLDTCKDMIRVRRVKFASGRLPKLFPWPEVHRSRTNSADNRAGFTKLWKIRQLETPYQQGKVAYPKKGFGHGTYNGLAGGRDSRDVLVQFKEDEFERLELGGKLPYDDMLDSEALVAMPQAQAAMRRPKKGGGYSFRGVEYPEVTTRNPWGIPGGEISLEAGMEGRTWMSM